MRAPKWRPAPPPGLVMGPAMSPADNKQDQEEHVFMMKDKKYELHGVILMLVLVSIFSVFIFFIAVRPCIKMASNSSSSSSTQSEDGYCSYWIKLWRRIKRSSRNEDGDGAPEVVSQSHHHHQQQEGNNIDEDEISKNVTHT
ncbi:hypothetical protein FEM48_Zijuj02G0106100 [Ziziphus jujuba var. spinosa]|nr:hypothetical protein FEM48_Zijuj02G0106100 [Ziziphus jujuba var. spinosa]